MCAGLNILKKSSYNYRNQNYFNDHLLYSPLNTISDFIFTLIQNKTQTTNNYTINVISSYMITLNEVLRAENDWAEAHLKTDANALDNLMHPDYSIIRPDGSVWNKEKALSSYVPGKRNWEIAESTDHMINVYGNVAVVVGIWRAKGVNNGVHFNYKARYSSVWAKNGGVLRIVLDQSTELKP